MAKTLRQQYFAFAGPTREIPSGQDRPILPISVSQSEHRIRFILPARGASHIISNGNRTEWSPIRSVIIRVITKSDDRAAGVRFVYHEYDYRQNWTTRSLVTN